MLTLHNQLILKREYIFMRSLYIYSFDGKLSKITLDAGKEKINLRILDFTNKLFYSANGLRSNQKSSI